MIKFLKNKQNLLSILVLVVVFTVIYWGGFLVFDDTEMLEELESQLEVLDEAVVTLEQLADTVEQRQATLEETLYEYNELLKTRLEQNDEFFLKIEQRIARWQDLLNNSELDRTNIRLVQAEMTDMMQTLKLINETGPTDLTESTSLQNNSTETE